ncbi:MAG: polyprenyl synthetase family protein, partial [Kiritimatiellae bacterium]|nr:polyprenyl synthetase family protein [Kiritimatiellia bacterium]
WWDVMAAVPPERRILLLPQCLRSRKSCRAETDGYGLLCRQCGGCPIGALQVEAEDMGYVTLVAEGTTVVTKLLESGRVDAVIGVSCTDVLERAFPYTAAYAVPSIAIPLLRDGCENTAVDEDWIREAIRLRSSVAVRSRPSLEDLRREVEGWFTPETVRRILGATATDTENIAILWLTKAGKRWRPVLTVAVFEALAGPQVGIPSGVRDLAIAVECFHKASLVHDDIEDNDELRYGEATLHRQHGLPVALNIGDLLVGEGYRLIARAALSAEHKARALAVAAEGHRRLCLGQGEELNPKNRATVLRPHEVLNIFRLKTAPAFEVAMRLGAICADADDAVCGVLSAFSEAIGIAFQIRDDLDDAQAVQHNCHAFLGRPSLMLALAGELAGPEAEKRLELAASGSGAQAVAGFGAWLAELGVEEKARKILEHYRRQAFRALAPVRNAELKALLYRITSRILGGV